MTIKFGMVMDPIETIVNAHNETSFAILYEAQNRGHETFYMAHNDLFIQGNKYIFFFINILHCRIVKFTWIF